MWIAMKRLLIIFPLFIMALSCSLDDNEMVEPEELGVKESSVTVACTAGTHDLEILSDGEFTLSLPSDAPWLSLEKGRSIKGSGDSSVKLVHEMNRGPERTAVISIDRGRKHIEVSYTQQGVLSAGIEFGERSITVPASAGSHSVRLLTLFKDSELEISVSYKGTGGWISDFRKSNNNLLFDVIENAGDENRIAEILVKSKNDESIFDVLQICQLAAGETLTVIGYGQLSDVASGVLTGPGLCLEGIVVSDNSEGNGGPNRNISVTLQDNTLTERTVYVQAADGSAGVKLVFDTVGDNITRRYDAVKILLDGADVKAFADPVRYEISGITSANLLSTRAGSSFDVVKKEKRMSELTDADVHTYVTLKDCEIPIRKGPFFPIELRLKNVINRYPMLIRDIEGGSMYLMTNFTASWQRDGKVMPQGSGTISGIIVHETSDNYCWDKAKAQSEIVSGIKEEYVADIGEIGKYQIRPVTRGDIRLADNVEDGFSEILMEVRYYNKGRSELVVNVDGNTIYSTWPAVEFPLSDSAVKGKFQVISSTGEVTGVLPYRDWTLLGPYVDGRIGDVELGNGVTDFFGTSILTNIISVSADSGLLESDNGSAWYCSQWSEAKHWKATFSTKGLTAANFPLSVQFGAVSGLGESVGAPRYWKIEYSVDGSSWNLVDSYTVPDFPIRSNAKQWQCPGFKYMNFNLPEDAALLDRDEVYVRMHPANTQAGTSDTYDGGNIVSSARSELNYFAVRYNK